MISLRKEEIDAIVHFLDVDCIFVRRMLQDQLFQVQECPLMWHLLAHLNTCSPGVVSVALRAIRALMVILSELHLEALLHNCTISKVRLHSDLDLYTSRVRFRPDEACVDDPQLIEAP